MTGVYHVAILTPPGLGGENWSLDIHDEDLFDRDEAIEWVNGTRPAAPLGTLYRLIELTQDELNEILEEHEDEDDDEWRDDQ